MQRFTPSRLPDHALLPALTDVCSRDRATTAEMLGLIAEVDHRRLYKLRDHTSMFAYCVRELRMSEDTAAKRIHAARAARSVPEVFAMIADGRLSLSAAWLLAPRLTPANAEDLLAAATHKTNDEIRLLLAERFPQPDVPTRVVALVPVTFTGALPAATAPAAPTAAPTAAQTTDEAEVPLGATSPSASPGACESGEQHAVRHVALSDCAQSPGSMVPVSTHARITPLSLTSYKYEFTFGKPAHEKLKYAKALLGHAVPSGDLPEVLERALDALIEKLEKAKLGKRSRTRPNVRRRTGRKRLEPNERHVPDHIKSAVWERDGGQCTFRGQQGHRCEARTRLELDHIQPIARGGLSTLGNLRLLCHAHNQLEAERTYGSRFIQGKRERARGAVDGNAPAAAP